MKRFVLALVLVAASTPRAAEREATPESPPADATKGTKKKPPTSKDATGTKKKSTTSKDATESDQEHARRKYEEKKKAEAEKARGAIKKPDGTLVEVKDLQEVNKRMSMFIFEVDSCERPASCDREALDDAEHRFMKVCGVCATAEKCEAARAKIRAGGASTGNNPCSE
jgi:hypothetical protein